MTETNTQNNIPVSQLGANSRGHASQALVVQGYALSALRQPNIDVKGFDQLQPIGKAINDRLDIARDHSTFYLDTLLPRMIGTVTDIDQYVNLHNGLANALDPSKSQAEAVALLKVAQGRVQDYQKRAGVLVVDLGKLRTMFSDDSRVFQDQTNKLNVAVEGDGGVLTSLEKDLADIDGKIAGAITGVTLGGLAIVGGGFMIAVGAIAGFVTAGTSSVLVVGGVGVVVAGVAAVTASSIALAGFLDMKGSALHKQTHLKEEVKLAAGLRSGIESLANAASSAASATQDMANAWSFMDQHLGNLASNLETGALGTESVRKMFQDIAQSGVQDVKNDVNLIQRQLAGVELVKQSDKPIGEVIRLEAQRVAA
jgi:non-hemolytic enterotoxin B/C